MNDSDLITLTIDGRKVSVPKGTPVIEAARQLGIEIPFFCYHPRLSMENGANCRMCLVEVGTPRKNPDGSETVAFMPKPQTACSLPVSEGMVVRTESPQITRDRKGVLEFLLINHPLDCPICDRGGECRQHLACLGLGIRARLPRAPDQTTDRALEGPGQERAEGNLGAGCGDRGVGQAVDCESCGIQRGHGVGTQLLSHLRDQGLLPIPAQAFARTHVQIGVTLPRGQDTEERQIAVHDRLHHLVRRRDDLCLGGKRDGERRRPP